jgi:hypothetical protein
VTRIVRRVETNAVAIGWRAANIAGRRRPVP